MNTKRTPFPETGAPTRASAQGFTLVELLVVIGIIALLAGLSSTAVTGAIRMANAAKCTSNMHSIGVGFFSYLSDHDYNMPQRKYDDGTPYYAVLAPYTGNDTTTKSNSVFVCPTQVSNDFPGEPSYGMNWYYDNYPYSSVGATSTTIMVAETYGSNGTGSNRADRDSGDPGELDPERHGGKSNYLFFDGHVAKLSYAQTTVIVGATDMWGTNDNNHDVMSP